MLTGTLNISDDIIIHGKTCAEHDRNLEAVFKRLQERNLTLNKRKCEFGKSTLKFFGLIFSDKGFSPDHEKLETIKSVERPQNHAEIGSFLGMTN